MSTLSDPKNVKKRKRKETRAISPTDDGLKRTKKTYGKLGKYKSMVCVHQELERMARLSFKYYEVIKKFNEFYSVLSGDSRTTPKERSLLQKTEMKLFLLPNYYDELIEECEELIKGDK